MRGTIVMRFVGNRQEPELEPVRPEWLKFEPLPSHELLTKIVEAYVRDMEMLCVPHPPVESTSNRTAMGVLVMMEHARGLRGR